MNEAGRDSAGIPSVNPPQFLDIEKLQPETLGLHPPPLRSAEDTFWQFSYIKQAARDLGAKSVAIENHYIDRDYIEDHSVFYAKSLHNYKNSCQRLHFFRLPEADLRQALDNIANSARGEPGDYTSSCQEFSGKNYCGFSVIKPLRGSPVGRTVLSAPPGLACSRRYEAHLLGVELTVFGVPFQQQDVGVSACATTALWTSLRVLSGLEPITPATPAQITKLAAQSYLPFGRAMPQSEGLNVGQMCQAVEALGVAPLLLPPANAEEARGLLYSILKSKIAPILMITEHEQRNGHRQSHAVTVTGFELLTGADDIKLSNSLLADPAMRLSALRLHDDRIGPYLRAVIDPAPSPNDELLLHLRGGKPDPQTWRLISILVPIHSKVRLSFLGLRKAAIELAAKASEIVAAQTAIFPGDDADPPISFESWFWRTHKYVEDLIRASDIPVPAALQLSSRFPLPRYLGIVRLRAPFLEHPVDILIDTTSTNWNLHLIATLPLGPAGGLATTVATALAEFASREDEPVPVITHAPA